MRRSTIVIAGFAALVAAENAAADARPAWRVMETSGVVMLADDVRCFASKPDFDLPPNVVVETLADASITLMRGETSVVVSPDSRLKLLADRGLEMRVAQAKGMAWFKVEKGKRPHFSVETPELTATVKGTAFTVAIDSVGAAVHVREGAVEVATDWRDAVTLVQAGTMARVQRAAPDRITLMNGGNVLRTVTGYDIGSVSDGALRRNGESTEAGSLFTAAAAEPAPLRATPAVHFETTSGVSIEGTRRESTQASYIPPVALSAVETRATPPARAASRSVLPVWETTLAALALLILMVMRTFFVARRGAKAVRVDAKGP